MCHPVFVVNLKKTAGTASLKNIKPKFSTQNAPKYISLTKQKLWKVISPNVYLFPSDIMSSYDCMQKTQFDR